jgi:hypothetical protein
MYVPRVVDSTGNRSARDIWWEQRLVIGHCWPRHKRDLTRNVEPIGDHLLFQDDMQKFPQSLLLPYR